MQFATGSPYGGGGAVGAGGAEDPCTRITTTTMATHSARAAIQKIRVRTICPTPSAPTLRHRSMPGEGRVLRNGVQVRRPPCDLFLLEQEFPIVNPASLELLFPISGSRFAGGSDRQDHILFQIMNNDH